MEYKNESIMNIDLDVTSLLDKLTKEEGSYLYIRASKNEQGYVSLHGTNVDLAAMLYSVAKQNKEFMISLGILINALISEGVIEVSSIEKKKKKNHFKNFKKWINLS